MICNRSIIIFYFVTASLLVVGDICFGFNPDKAGLSIAKGKNVNQRTVLLTSYNPGTTTQFVDAQKIKKGLNIKIIPPGEILWALSLNAMNPHSFSLRDHNSAGERLEILRVLTNADLILARTRKKWMSWQNNELQTVTAKKGSLLESLGKAIGYNGVVKSKIRNNLLIKTIDLSHLRGVQGILFNGTAKLVLLGTKKHPRNSVVELLKGGKEYSLFKIISANGQIAVGDKVLVDDTK